MSRATRATHSFARVLAFGAVLLLALPVQADAQGRGGGGQQGPAINQPDNPALQGFRWREIGPTGQGGRVDDIAVVESDKRIFYIGFATGGLWKTVNNGTTFEPIFDTYGTHSIGDIGIAQSNPDVLYIGTGEANNRQSSSFGDGIYKSTDGGETFTHVGLRETQTIARVVVHPTNPDVVWVAANGHLFGPNPERGVFKTTNGGQSWNKVLYVDESTGATDLAIDPSNPNTLYAATYGRQRTAFGFASGGGGSGIWKSTDGGNNWTRLSGNGLPRGTMGRIALDVARSAPSVVYAQIEVAQDNEPYVEPPPQPEGGRGGGGRGGGDQPPNPQSSGVWRSTDGGNNWEFRSNENGRPMYFSQLRVSTEDPEVVWVVDQNVHKSMDGGRTFQQTNGYGHVDQHALWIDPDDHDHVMIGNDGSVDVTYDQGETWESLRPWAVGQPYHVSVGMDRPYSVCTGLQDNGSWCGPSSVRSGSILAQDWFRAGGGDGFYSQIDPTNADLIYTESQNGNVSRYNLATGEGGSIRPRAAGGGRGGGGGGRGGGQGNIEPEPEDDIDIRFNWNTPFMLSPHDPNTIYVGGNFLFISNDRGDTYRMTPDLTKNIDRETRSIMGLPLSMPSCSGRGGGTPGVPCILSRNDGISDYGTIVTISESSVVPGILWVGTDDGNIQVSRDHGLTWSEVGQNLPDGPKEYYVSRVEASHFDPGTAYASFDGHRSDDLRPYVYVTRNFGQTWTSISGNLPQYGNVNTVRQDLRNPNLLFAGTEFGFFASLDEGQTWHRFMPNLPVVRIDDVVIHPREMDLVLATHGRSVQIMDDITALQQLTPEVMAQPAHLMQPREAVIWGNDRRQSRSVTGDKNWTGQNAPEGTAIAYYLGSAPSGQVSLTIHGPDGEVFRTLEATRNQGLNRVFWNLRGDPDPEAGGGGGRGGGGGGGGGRGGGGGQGPMADPGAYRVTLTVNGQSYMRAIRVLADIWMEE